MISFRSLSCAGTALAASLLLAACGGGGSTTTTTTTGGSGSGLALSSGTVTAFGSVFVNGHEFDISAATVSDADGDSVSASDLATGMTVDVTPSSSSTASAPRAQTIGIVPMVRGPVDASDTSASQLSVMGQVVQLTTTSVFKDARVCARTGAVNACTPITAQAALVAACSQTGSAAYVCGSTAPNQVQVFGYVNPASNSVTATLVRVIDNAASLYRATGVITVASSGTTPASYSIDGLDFAPGVACGGSIDCDFATGDVAFTRGTIAPTRGTPGTALPIPVVFPAVSLHKSHAAVLAVGSTVELEGVVSSASGSTFRLAGVTITLGSGEYLPSDGDLVEVAGTVTTAGTASTPPAVTATSITTENSAAHGAGGGFLLEATLSSSAVAEVTPATTPPSYTVAILGTTVQVNALTRLADETTAQPAFNINDFATYLAGTTPHVVVTGYIDKSSGTPVLVAHDFRIVAAPSGTAAYNARVGGRITALSTGSLTVDGIALTFTGTPVKPGGSTTTLAVGDYVGVRIALNGAVLGVVGVTDYGAVNEVCGD